MYLYNVVVTPQRRQQGIGKQLIEAAKEYVCKEIEREGGGGILCLAHVENVNTAAARLYATCGFEPLTVNEANNQTIQHELGQRTLLKLVLL